MCYTNGQIEMKNMGRRKEIWEKQESIRVWGTIGHMYTRYQAQVHQKCAKGNTSAVAEERLTGLFSLMLKIPEDAGCWLPIVVKPSWEELCL